MLNHLTDEVFAALEGLPVEGLNWRPPLPNANSPFAIATHIVGSGEWWILRNLCGQARTRDREAEFHAEATPAGLAPLRARFDAWLRECRAALAALPREEWERVREVPRPAGEPRWLTGRQCMLHSLEHTALHLGHLQLTRQLWEAQRRG